MDGYTELFAQHGDEKQNVHISTEATLHLNTYLWEQLNIMADLQQKEA